MCIRDRAGTTRDIIEDYINLDGVLLKITDTAGIRETDDEVEKIGVNIAREKLKEADLVIAIFDISRDFDKDDEEILNPVSYTHLDVYKRQVFTLSSFIKSFLFSNFEISIL